VQYLALGLTMGLGSGVAPGPLLALVLVTSLKEGFRGGARVALAPLISDTPIVIASVLAVGSLPEPALRGLALVGGCYVVWLGVDAMRRIAAYQDPLAGGRDQRVSVLRAALVNVLSPHPWLFWITVGSPILVRAWQDAWWNGMGFLLGFYALLLGSKVAMAALVATGRHALGERGMRLAQAGAGALLVAAGTALLVEAAFGA